MQNIESDAHYYANTGSNTQKTYTWHDMALAVIPYRNKRTKSMIRTSMELGVEDASGPHQRPTNRQTAAAGSRRIAIASGVFVSFGGWLHIGNCAVHAPRPGFGGPVCLCPPAGYL